MAINWGEWQWNAWEKGLAGYSPEVQAFFRAKRERKRQRREAPRGE